MTQLVYVKLLHVSSASNKQYKKGDILNFVAVDGKKLVFIAEQVPTLIKLPFQILVTAALLAWLGIVTGVILVLFSFFLNFTLAKVSQMV